MTKSRHKCIPDLHRHRGRLSAESLAIFLGELQVDGGEVHAVLEYFLIGLHLLDLAPDSRYLFFNLEHIFDSAGVLRQQFA